MSRLLTRIAITLALLLATLSWATGPIHPVHASSTLTVTNCGDGVRNNNGTLRYVIENAAAGDTITFACSGPVVLQFGATELAKNLTIDGGAQGMTIDGGACALGVFYVDTSASVTLQNLSIVHCETGTTKAGTSGYAAVQVNPGSTLTVSNSTFSGNIDGTAHGFGAIWNFGTLIVNNSTFSNNHGTLGGAIGNDGTGATLTVTNSTFSGNDSVSDGGAIENSGKDATVTNSTFVGNSAALGSGGGGAIANGSSSILTVTNSIFSTNSASNGTGGAIMNLSTATVTNSVFIGNTSNWGAGGINGGGYDAGYPYGSGTTKLTNSTLTNNRLNSGLLNCAGNGNNGIQNGGGNHADDSSCTGSTASGLPTSLNLGPLGHYGGPTQTIKLLSGSPAINAGSSSICNASPVSGKDQRGLDRGDSKCDAGAYDTSGADIDLGLTGMPANITTVGTSASGAAVTFTLPTATDDDGDTPVATVSCNHDSGSIFPIGVTTVTCTATDSDDTPPSVSKSFTVTVNPDTDLALTGMPADISAIATGPSGATVSFTLPTATDEADVVAPTVGCKPASGSTFPLGDTTVTCTANDSDDTPPSVSKSFTVSVTDLPPTTTDSSPYTAKAGTAGFTLTVDGTHFWPSFVVKLDGAALPTHFVSATQLTADVPANLAAKTMLITVVDPAPKGVTSNPRMLYVTTTGTTLIGKPHVSDFYAEIGNLLISQTGGPSNTYLYVALAMYAANPADSLPVGGTGTYFDVYVAPGSSLTGLFVQKCGLAAGSQFKWWNGTDWVVVSSLHATPLYPDGTICLNFSANTSSSPTIAQLNGTPFTVALPGKMTGLTVATASGTYGGTVDLSATLAAGTTPVDGKTVNFSLNGISVCGGPMQPTCPTTDASGLATLSSVSLSGINAGTYATGVSASFAGDSGYISSSGSNTLTVSKVNQTITVTTAAPSNNVYAGTFTVAATSDSGQTVSYGSAGGCTNTGANYTMISGTTACTVTFDQIGNTNYNAATQVTETVTATKAEATIVLSNLNQVYDGSAKYATTAPSGLSGISVIYSQGGTAVSAPTNAGSYSVDASLSSDNYTASNATATLVIAKASQIITFDLSTLPAKTYGDGPFSISSNASASSTLPVTFSSDSLTTSVCTVSGSTVTIVSAGTCIIHADGAGNDNYNMATRVSQRFTVGKAPLTVTASHNAITYGDPAPTSFTISYSGFIPGDTQMVVVGSSAPTCGTSYTQGSAATAYGINCTIGTLTSDNYTFVNSFGTAFPANTASAIVVGQFTVNPASLTVLASSPADQIFGRTSSPTVACSVTGFYGKDAFKTSPTGAVYATAGSSSPVTISATSNAGSYVTKCAGGNAGGNYTILYNNGTFTIHTVSTTTLYTGTQLWILGGTGQTWSLNATVSPSTCSSGGSGSVLYTLDRNPITGTVGSYPLSSAPDLTWQRGVYTLTATYTPGSSGNCAASSDTALLTIGGVGNSASGLVWTTVPGYGPVTIIFSVRAIRTTSSIQYKGQFLMMGTGNWHVDGVLSSYSRVGSSGAASGTATVYRQNTTTLTGVGFTISFTANSSAGKKGTADTFGLHFSLPGPTSFAPIALQGGILAVH